MMLILFTCNCKVNRMAVPLVLEDSKERNTVGRDGRGER